MVAQSRRRGIWSDILNLLRRRQITIEKTLWALTDNDPH